MDSELKHLGTQSQESVNMAAASAQKALEKTKDKVDEATSAFDDLAASTSAALQDAKETLGDLTDQLRQQLKVATDMAIAYTKEEPITALLLSAAAGALLMALVTMLIPARD